MGFIIAFCKSLRCIYVANTNVQTVLYKDTYARKTRTNNA